MSKTNAAERIENDESDESEGPKSGRRPNGTRRERVRRARKRKASWQAARGMFDVASVGKRIRDLRLARSLSLVTMHARGAPTPSMLSTIENGLNNPDVHTIHAIARALNVRPFILFVGKDRLSRFFLDVDDDAAFDRLQLALMRIGY
jgi:ribosome-binding protein aMBF1 (putative translation factor)